MLAAVAACLAAVRVGAVRAAARLLELDIAGSHPDALAWRFPAR